MTATSALQRRFWASSRRVALWSLVVWLLVSLGVPWFARDLQGMQGFGFPLGFWLAAQGALLVYLGIIVVDVVVMERLEARYRHEAAGQAPVVGDGVVLDARADADSDADTDATALR